MFTQGIIRELAKRVAVVAIVAAFAGGCRIPAIDPTGERIFTGGTTTLASHDLAHCLPHHREAPVVQPPCAPPIEVVPVVVQPAPQPIVAVPQPAPLAVLPVSCGPPATCAPITMPQTPLPPPLQVKPACPEEQCEEKGPRLIVTPARIVAPVNSEVILAAGVCDGDGYYLMRQPLEWMLAQDGVGQVVAVGHESRYYTSYLLRHSPQKVATNYVRAHTSSISQTLDRGTKNPHDDVFLRRGQAWITVTSPTEGTSHVVVWAPKEHNWERRKATATILWVDALWQFPPPAAGRAGQKQVLTTVLTRSSGDPISGWIVRYEVLEGPEAAFAAGRNSPGGRVAEVQTDGAGRATVELSPRSTEPGITTIGIQIIRPARAGEPQLVVGQGVTHVSWSVPGLQVTAVGSSSVAADGAINYRVEVTNRGDLPTRGVTLSFTPPTGVSLLNSTPAAQTFGQRCEWRLGDIPARMTVPIEVNCRASVAADVRSCFRARSSDGLDAEGCATTRVFANNLSVKMTGPEAVEVGREARYLVEVTNTGPTTLTNVTASDTFDPGLSHAQGERSPIIRTLAAPLAPGQTDRFAVTFIVREPGRHCHRMDVSADGGHRASARACVTGTQSAAPTVIPPRLSVKVTGPRTERVGEIAEYIVTVTNSGTAATANVTINVQYGVNLELTEASRGHIDDPRRLTTEWRGVQIAGGETITRQLNCRCLNIDDQASVRATISAAGITPQSAETRTTILAGSAPPRGIERPMPPRGQDAPAQPPAADVPGSLKATIAETADPIQVGRSTTYVITLTNDRAVSDQDVAITLQLSEGLKVTGAKGPTGIASSSPDSRVVELTPLRELRAGEQAVYRIEVTGTRAGKQRGKVTAKSTRTPAGTSVETETTVNMP